MSTEEQLRRALTDVRLAPAYEAAVEKGIKAGRQFWPDSEPGGQLMIARRAAMRELSILLGWNV